MPCSRRVSACDSLNSSVEHEIRFEGRTGQCARSLDDRDIADVIVFPTFRGRPTRNDEATHDLARPPQGKDAEAHRVRGFDADLTRANRLQHLLGDTRLVDAAGKLPGRNLANWVQPDVDHFDADASLLLQHFEQRPGRW